MPTIEEVKAIVKQHNLTGAVLVSFSPDGQFGITSYGVDRECCRMMKSVGDDIESGIRTGLITPSL